MYFDYLNVLVFASVGFIFVFVNMIVGSFVRPRRKTNEGLEIYECGEEPIGDAWIQFDIRYYTVALVYVIFAVEIAFLFPWALVLQESFKGTGAAAGSGIGYFALIEGVVFISILFLGLAYVWAKGDLDWILAYQGKTYEPRYRDMKMAPPSLEEIEGAGKEDAAPDEPGDTGDSGETEEAA